MHVARAAAIAVAGEGRWTDKDASKLLRAIAPSLELAAQLFARRSLQVKRTLTSQDFWDTEHATLAPVYADAFVSDDRSLMAVLRESRRSAGANAALLNGPADLLAWLQDGAVKDVEDRHPVIERARDADDTGMHRADG
jgi:2-keto-4-pentenoate hydratase